jgi:hypothetical protein
VTKPTCRRHPTTGRLTHERTIESSVAKLIRSVRTLPGARPSSRRRIERMQRANAVRVAARDADILPTLAWVYYKCLRFVLTTHRHNFFKGAVFLVIAFFCGLRGLTFIWHPAISAPPAGQTGSLCLYVDNPKVAAAVLAVTYTPRDNTSTILQLTLCSTSPKGRRCAGPSCWGCSSRCSRTATTTRSRTRAAVRPPRGSCSCMTTTTTGSPRSPA